MSWQDLVLAAGGFILSAGIIPTVRGPVKPALTTTVTFVAVLAASAVAFVTLGLWLTAAGVGIQCVLWSVILGQTLLARHGARPLTEPVVTAPDLGFEEFSSAK